VIRDGKRPCITCKRELELSCFYSYSYTTKQGKASTRHDSRCTECSRAKRKLQSVNKAASAAWYAANSEQQRAYRSQRQQDPAHRANKARAQRMRKARMRAGGAEKDPAIRAVYQEAMDWEQKLALCVASDDPLDLKVHVDHVRPLSKGGLHIASNLQVTSAYFNLKKGASHA